MHDETAPLVRMANQIATFFEAQTGGDAEAAAEALAGHLRLFWAPPMRLALLGLSDEAAEQLLEPIALLALRLHGDRLRPGASTIRGALSEVFPQGGGDAG